MKNIITHRKILLSGGSFPWFGILKNLKFIKKIGYDGLELLPTRRVVWKVNGIVKKHDIKDLQKNIGDLNYIKAVHQNWRLDNKKDNQYGISFFPSLIFRVIRYVFFPQIKDSNRIINFFVSKINVPITVHDLSCEWVRNPKNKIHLEIFNSNMKKEELKTWLKFENHSIAIDTRDDQSLLWAKNNGFKDWKEFWNWIGLENIENIQLTLIGTRGLKNIFDHKNSIAEEQFIWLNGNNWKGSVVIEVNPISLLLNKVTFKKGLKIIKQFVETTLDKGQKWS